MKDNTKITLTIGQLKRLVKESLDGDFPKILGTACRSIKFEATDLVDYFDGWYKAEEAGDKKEALIYLRQIKNAGANIDQMLDDIRNLDIGDTPAISGWKGGPVTEDDEGGEPTFDISAAIKAGNIRFEGISDSKSHRSHSYIARSKPVSHPSAASAHLFGVSLFQPCDGGFLNLDFDFDMGHAGVKYYFGPDTNETPWDNRRRPLRGEARKIDDALADDIKNNQDLLNALKDFINYHAPQDDDPVGNNARKMEDMLKRWNGIGAYIDSWNARVED